MCIYGWPWHKWERWSEAYLVSWADASGKVVANMRTQKRACLKCNKQQERLVT